MKIENQNSHICQKNLLVFLNVLKHWKPLRRSKIRRIEVRFYFAFYRKSIYLSNVSIHSQLLIWWLIKWYVSFKTNHFLFLLWSKLIKEIMFLIKLCLIDDLTFHSILFYHESVPFSLIKHNNNPSNKVITPVKFVLLSNFGSD